MKTICPFSPSICYETELLVLGDRLDTMAHQSTKEPSNMDRLDVTADERRISVGEAPIHTPTIVPQPDSPTISVRPNIENNSLYDMDSAVSTRKTSVATNNSLPVSENGNGDFRVSVFSEEKQALTPASSQAGLALSQPNGASDDASTRAVKSPIPSIGTSQGLYAGEPPQSIAEELAAARRRSILENPTFLNTDSSSSSESVEDGIMLSAATQARTTRPKLLGPESRGKAKQVLGVNLDSIAREQGGIPVSAISGSTVSPNDARRGSEKDSISPLSVRPFLKTPLTDALRANPPDSSLRRSATTPVRPIRRATIIPPPVDTTSGRKGVGQHIVSTPYPFAEPDKKDRYGVRPIRSLFSSKPPPESVVPLEAKDNSKDAILTIVLHSLQSNTPSLGTIFVPRRNSTPFHETLDDEKLIRKIRAEYFSLRGWWKVCLAARSLSTIRVIAFRKSNDLTTFERALCHHHDTNEADRNLSDMMRYPRAGRRRTGWVEWVRGLPQNSTVEAPWDKHVDGCKKVALEIVETWSPFRITLAIVSVGILSIIAVVLWTILGINQQEGLTVEHESSTLGWRGSGGRVQTASLLGVLTLLLGWSGISGWLFLSWACM